MKNVVQDLTSAGHEWMRAKWSAPIRKYWKISEQMMVKYCDLAICDSVNIDIERKLQEGKKVLFVGLPCQVAALKNFSRNQDNLYQECFSLKT